jgi:hypothetical protein
MEHTMPCNEQTRVRIELTPEQRKHVQSATGEHIDTLEFTVEELEQRVAPAVLKGQG